LSLTDEFPGILLVVPKARFGHSLVDFIDAFLFGRQVKESLANAKCAR